MSKWIKWPFMLRSTHERELQAQAYSSALELARASDTAAAASGAKRFAESRVQTALVRAEAAEAQLKQLAGPVLEVVRRSAALTVIEQTSPAGAHTVKAISCLTIPDGILPAFSGHPRVLGYAVQDLVHGAMQLLQQRDHAAAGRNDQTGGES